MKRMLTAKSKLLMLCSASGWVLQEANSNRVRIRRDSWKDACEEYRGRGRRGGRKDFRLPSRYDTCGMRGVEEGAGGKSPSLQANFEKAVSPMGSSSTKSAQEDFYMGQKGQESAPTAMLSHYAGASPGKSTSLGKVQL